MSGENNSLPYSEDCEKGALSSFILAPDNAGERCLVRLQPEYFYNPAHRIIYEALSEWHKAEQVDFVWLKNQVNKSGQLDEVGGPEFLNSLWSFVPAWNNIDWYIDGVVDAWRRRSAILEYRRREKAAQHEPIESFDPEGLFGPRENGGLPPFESLVDLSSVDLPEPEVLIAGLLHAGSKLSIGGASKSYKTWSLIEMGLSVATGRPWLGHKTKQRRVLYINLELQKAFFRKRIEAVVAAKGLPINGPWKRNFVAWNLRGYCVNSDSLCKEILRRTRKADTFGLIIIDPLYKILGNRQENSNDQIAALLNLLERVARETSAAIAYGNTSAKAIRPTKSQSIAHPAPVCLPVIQIQFSRLRAAKPTGLIPSRRCCAISPLSNRSWCVGSIRVSFEMRPSIQRS